MGLKTGGPVSVHERRKLFITDRPPLPTQKKENVLTRKRIVVAKVCRETHSKNDKKVEVKKRPQNKIKKKNTN